MLNVKCFHWDPLHINVVTTGLAYLPLHIWDDEMEHRRAAQGYAEWPLRSRQHWRRRPAKSHQKFETLVRQYDSDSAVPSTKFELELLSYVTNAAHIPCVRIAKGCK